MTSVDYVFVDRSVFSEAEKWITENRERIVQPPGDDEEALGLDRVRNGVVITRLIETLRERGSWCGETHVQKAAFFLQELMEVPTRFHFILYKHGPFSFDLRDELTARSR